MGDSFRAELLLSSRWDAIEIACVVLDEGLRQTVGEYGAAHRVEFAMREALANAIRHGNGPGSPEPVDLDLSIEKGLLRIEVRDRGKGFDHESLPDPGKEENILRSHGRGIFSMRECMNSVSFSARAGGGTIVTMYRSLVEDR